MYLEFKMKSQNKSFNQERHSNKGDHVQEAAHNDVYQLNAPSPRAELNIRGGVYNARGARGGNRGRRSPRKDTEEQISVGFSVLDVEKWDFMLENVQIKRDERGVRI